MQWIRKHLSFANAISMVALFVALGGTSYALAKNSIGAKEIKKNAIGASEVKKNAVRASEIKANAVGASEIRSNAVAGGDIVDNGVGAPDLADSSIGAGEVIDGSLGKTDLQAGLVNHTVTVQFEQAAAALGNGAELSLDVHCPPGQTAIGGGTRGDVTNSELTKVTASRPIIATNNSGAPGDNGTFTGWRGTFVNEENGADIKPEVWVICMTQP